MDWSSFMISICLMTYSCHIKQLQRSKNVCLTKIKQCLKLYNWSPNNIPFFSMFVSLQNLASCETKTLKSPGSHLFLQPFLLRKPFLHLVNSISHTWSQADGKFTSITSYDIEVAKNISTQPKSFWKMVQTLTSSGSNKFMPPGCTCTSRNSPGDPRLHSPQDMRPLPTASRPPPCRWRPSGQHQVDSHGPAEGKGWKHLETVEKVDFFFF